MAGMEEREERIAEAVGEKAVSPRLLEQRVIVEAERVTVRSAMVTKEVTVSVG